MTIQPPFLTRLAVLPKRVNREAFPFNTLPFLTDDFDLDLTSPVTFLIGENGVGKSTLLEAIAAHAGFHASGGRRDYQVHDDRADDDTTLGRAMRFSWRIKTNHSYFFRADRFTQVARYIEDEGDVRRFDGKFGSRSHGESVLTYFQTELRPKGRSLFLVDEPEAALSPLRQLAFLGLLSDWQKSGQVQAVIATHSPIIMAFPEATILQITENGVAAIDYLETDHYRVTKSFLADPIRSVREITKTGD